MSKYQGPTWHCGKCGTSVVLGTEEEAHGCIPADAPALLARVAELEGLLDAIEGNLCNLANARFVWCEHPDGEDAKKNFAAALWANASRIRAALAGKKGAQ